MACKRIKWKNILSQNHLYILNVRIFYSNLNGRNCKLFIAYVLYLVAVCTAAAQGFLRDISICLFSFRILAAISYLEFWNC
jgi:hypothetical protein